MSNYPDIFVLFWNLLSGTQKTASYHSDYARQNRLALYKNRMENDIERGKALRTKNWVLFALLLGFMLLLYSMSFIKFGETIYS